MTIDVIRPPEKVYGLPNQSHDSINICDQSLYISQKVLTIISVVELALL